LDGEALSELAFGPDGFHPGPVYEHLEDVCVDVRRSGRRLVIGSFWPVGCCSAIWTSPCRPCACTP
jgi:hypothetical protein